MANVTRSSANSEKGTPDHTFAQSKRKRGVESPKGKKTDGLFAIVIPSGGGKSTLCDELGQLDVDLILPRYAENELRIMREEACNTRNKMERARIWRMHNETWYEALATALSYYDFLNNPRVLFCHSCEVASAVGATVIAICSPTEACHNRNMSIRDRESQAFGQRNADIIRKYFLHHPYYYEYSDGEGLQSIVARRMAAYGYWPFIAKHVPLTTIKNSARADGYAANVPDAIMREKYNE